MTGDSPVTQAGDRNRLIGPETKISAPAPEAGAPRPWVRTNDPEGPWTDSRFWLLQIVVLALYLVRLAASVSLHLDPSSPAVEFTTVVVFLIPVVYAALNYGLAGALVTSLWVTVLAIPRFVSYLDDQEALGAWTEVMQVTVLNVIAILVGARVTSERTARREAEAAEQAHLRAEALYRNLFDSNQAPILITDGEGRVVEANSSALRIFPGTADIDASGGAIGGSRPRLLDVIGPEAASQVLTHLVSVRSPEGDTEGPTSPGERVRPVSFDVDGEPVLFRPTATTLEGGDGIHGMQVVFEDVTAETRRHDRMEAFAGRVVLAQEEERRHIAQELHDGPVQTLIHLCRQIDTFGEGLPVEPDLGDDPDRQTVSELRTIVEGTVAELRGIAKGLRPSILDDLGLVASISQLLADAEKRNEFETSIGVTGKERRLPPTVELALFRVSQEALSNVERHARATRVAVGLDFETNGLRLLVRDDGIGINPDTADEEARRGSLGLPGMAERANLIGGTFVIHSAPGDGTTVDVWVPDSVLSIR